MGLSDLQTPYFFDDMNQLLLLLLNKLWAEVVCIILSSDNNEDGWRSFDSMALPKELVT